VNPEFSGCLRDLSLNDESYDEDSADNKIGVVPCSQLTEDGIFFAKDGGYAMLPEFTANKQFHFELEVKPRVKNAVLLSVGVIEYVTMQLVNGTVKLTVDDGAGPESIHYVPPQGTMLCDGNWHRIKVSFE
jgi:laminin alpha 3/5